MLWINSLAPGSCHSNLTCIIFKLIMQNTCSILGTCHEIDQRWMSQNSTNEKSMLAQVMAWCHQATNHYLSECCPRFMASPAHNEWTIFFYNSLAFLQKSQLCAVIKLYLFCILDYAADIWMNSLDSFISFTWIVLHTKWWLLLSMYHLRSKMKTWASWSKWKRRYVRNVYLFNIIHCSLVTP